MDKYAKRTFISSPKGNGRERLTFAQIYEQSIVLAAWMQARGLGLGSRIAIGGKNSTG